VSTGEHYLIWRPSTVAAHPRKMRSAKMLAAALMVPALVLVALAVVVAALVAGWT
jgi:hypothetical protein